MSVLMEQTPSQMFSHSLAMCEQSSADLMRASLGLFSVLFSGLYTRLGQRERLHHLLETRTPSPAFTCASQGGSELGLSVFLPTWKHLATFAGRCCRSPACVLQLLFSACLTFLLPLLSHSQVPFPSFVLSTCTIVLPVWLS